MIHQYIVLIICLMSFEGIFTNTEVRDTSSYELSPGYKQQSLPQTDTYEKAQGLKTAMDVLLLLKNRDYQSLAVFAHPEKGILFSSDPFADYDEDRVFTAKQIKELSPDTIYSWGQYDGYNDFIEMTVEEYFDSYVYTQDYINSSQIGINCIVRSGNCPENVAEIYPDGLFFDFHYEGTKEYEGLDWHSLKIVFEKYNGDLKVVAILNSQYYL